MCLKSVTLPEKLPNKPITRNPNKIKPAQTRGTTSVICVANPWLTNPNGELVNDSWGGGNLANRSFATRAVSQMWTEEPPREWSPPGSWTASLIMLHFGDRPGDCVLWQFSVDPSAVWIVFFAVGRALVSNQPWLPQLSCPRTSLRRRTKPAPTSWRKFFMVSALGFSVSVGGLRSWASFFVHRGRVSVAKFVGFSVSLWFGCGFRIYGARLNHEF